MALRRRPGCFWAGRVTRRPRALRGAERAQTGHLRRPRPAASTRTTSAHVWTASTRRTPVTMPPTKHGRTPVSSHSSARSERTMCRRTPAERGRPSRSNSSAIRSRSSRAASVSPLVRSVMGVGAGGRGARRPPPRRDPADGRRDERVGRGPRPGSARDLTRSTSRWRPGPRSSPPPPRRTSVGSASGTEVDRRATGPEPHRPELARALLTASPPGPKPGAASERPLRARRPHGTTLRGPRVVS